MLSDDITVLETNDVHFDENSESNATNKEQQFMEFDMPDINITFYDLQKSHDSYKIFVYIECSDHVSEEKGADNEIERSTVLC